MSLTAQADKRNINPGFAGGGGRGSKFSLMHRVPFDDERAATKIPGIMPGLSDLIQL